jgi:hypothetical protein
VCTKFGHFRNALWVFPRRPERYDGGPLDLRGSSKVIRYHGDSTTGLEVQCFRHPNYYAEKKKSKARVTSLCQLFQNTSYYKLADLSALSHEVLPDMGTDIEVERAMWKELLDQAPTEGLYSANLSSNMSPLLKMFNKILVEENTEVTMVFTTGLWCMKPRSLWEDF